MVSILTAVRDLGRLLFAGLVVGAFRGVGDVDRRDRTPRAARDRAHGRSVCW